MGPVVRNLDGSIKELQSMGAMQLVQHRTGYLILCELGFF